MAVKIPKSVKLPWEPGRLLASAGSFVVAAGGLGELCRVDPHTWKAVPLRKVAGHVCGLAVRPGQLAIGVAASESSHIEIRDADDVQVAQIPTGGRNAVAMSWSPQGDLLLVQLSSNEQHPFVHFALVDPVAKELNVVACGPASSGVAAFHQDGASALAFVELASGEPGASSEVEGDVASALVERHRVLRILRDGRVEDLGTPDREDWAGYGQLLPLGERFLLLPLQSDDARFVDAQGATLAEASHPGGLVCVDGEGFASIHPFSTRIVRCGADLTIASKAKGKKAGSGVASAEGTLLVLQDGQIELL
jgi:hypothetical protein